MRVQVSEPLHVMIIAVAFRGASGLVTHREGSQPGGRWVQRDRGFNVHLSKFHSKKSICLCAHYSKTPPAILEGLLFNQGMLRHVSLASLCPQNLPFSPKGVIFLPLKNFIVYSYTSRSSYFARPYLKYSSVWLSCIYWCVLREYIHVYLPFPTHI